MPAIPRGEVSDAELQPIADYLAAGAGGRAMIRATPRAVVAGRWRCRWWRSGRGWRWQAWRSAAVLLHDPSLEAGRRFAEAGGRQARDVRNRRRPHPLRPRGVRERARRWWPGVSRPADLVLIADVRNEAG